jgi:hypothetical protein
MNPKRLIREVLISIAIFPICILTASPVAAQRGWHSGDTWMKWNDTAREAWYMGYVDGYMKAQSEICAEIARKPRVELNSADLSLDSCATGTVDYSKGSKYFTAQMTEFYKRYAQDRDLSLDEVVELLAKGLTFEQIHSYPFFRRALPANRP